jgi:hypothetical protein
MPYLTDLTLRSSRTVFLGVQFVLGGGALSSASLSGGLVRAQTKGELDQSQDQGSQPVLGKQHVDAMQKATKKMLRSGVPGTNLPHGSLEELSTATLAYAKELANAGDLSLEQLRTARSVMEETVLAKDVLACHVELRRSAGLDTGVAVMLEQITDGLVALKKRPESDLGAVRNELLTLYPLILQASSDSTARNQDRLIDLLINSYGVSQEISLCQIYSHLDLVTGHNSALVSRIVARHYDLLASSFKDEVGKLASPYPRNVGMTQELLQIHALVERDLSIAKSQGDLSADQEAEYSRALASNFMEPLVPYVLKAWHLGYQSRAPRMPQSIFDDQIYWNALSVEQIGLSRDGNIRALNSFLAAWSGDREKLGNAVFDQIDEQREAFGAHPFIGFQSIFFLPVIAPNPARKQEIIEDLRLGLVDDAAQIYIGATYDRPAQIARIVTVCLISDYLYCASRENEIYNPELALRLIEQLKDDATPLEPYQAVLTPTQLLIVELLRLSKGGEVAASVPWVAQYDARTRSSVMTRARSAIDGLINSLYACQPSDAFHDPNTQQATTMSTPREWGTAAIYPPAPGREREWIDARTSMFTLADLLVEDCVMRVPPSPSLYLLASHLTSIAEIIHRRGSDRDRNDRLSPCMAVKMLRGMYQEPPEAPKEPKTPPLFFNLAHSIRELQKTVEQGGGRHVHAKDRLPDLGSKYAEIMQRLCIAEFALRRLLTIHINGESAMGPLRRELVSTCEQFGFFERDEHLRKLLVSGNAATLRTDVQSYMLELQHELEDITKQLELEK